MTIIKIVIIIALSFAFEGRTAETIPDRTFSEDGIEYRLVFKSRNYAQAYDYCTNMRMRLAVVPNLRIRDRIDAEVNKVIEKPKGVTRSYWVGAMGYHMPSDRDGDSAEALLVNVPDQYLFKNAKEITSFICEKSCPVPPDGEAQTRTCKTKFGNGERASFSCPRNHALIGTGLVLCQNRWLGNFPKCRQRQCEELPSIRDGQKVVSSRTGRSIGTAVAFYCNSGSVLYGSDRTTCQPNGRWSDPVPTCRRTLCKRPTNPINGQARLVVGNGESIGSVYKFSCYHGYDLSGDMELYCDSTGKWSSNIPKCILPTCSRLPASLHNGGRLLASNNNYKGSVVTFSCPSRMAVVGAKSVTCRDDFRWSDDWPTCQPNSCTPLPFLQHGYMVRTSGLEVGSVVMMGCDDGYALDGSENIYCDEDRTWSDKVGTCREWCDSTADKMKVCNRPFINQTVTFRCSGQACYDVIPEVAWDMKTKYITGELVYNNGITHPEESTMQIEGGWDEYSKSWSQEVTMLIYDKDYRGKYSCSIDGQTRSAKIVPISKDKWGDVKCEGQRLILTGKALKSTYIQIKTEEKNQPVEVNGAAVDIPKSFGNKSRYDVEVCFCEQEFYPTGCAPSVIVTCQ